tara:strand:- start:245 stop:1030 length:786 start_codon:yes stop_codon:yes gene_type:complete
MKIKIKIINQLIDNYSYLIYDIDSKEALLVDPAEANPIIKFISINGIKLKGILITHHHSDHTSGIIQIKEKFNIKVFSPNKKIIGTTDLVKDKEQINFGFINFDIISTPGHTLDHVIYYCKQEKLLFSGDTLFYYGCGRIFEGTYEQMLNSLNKIKNLPNETQVYCGHEYTYKNLEFILDELVHWQDRGDIKQKCRKLIKEKGSSMPFLLGLQKDWNPFLNCNDIHYKKGVSDFHKNKGQIASDASELEFFTYIRDKRNDF